MSLDRGDGNDSLGKKIMRSIIRLFFSIALIFQGICFPYLNLSYKSFFMHRDIISAMLSTLEARERNEDLLQIINGHGKY